MGWNALFACFVAKISSYVCFKLLDGFNVFESKVLHFYEEFHASTIIVHEKKIMLSGNLAMKLH